MDSYFTVEVASQGEYKEKGSKFLAYVFPMESEHQLSDFIAKVKSEHPKARHYCYAYRLGQQGQWTRVNDDGEPSGTAGKPIFGQILRFGFSDVLIVVTRYFGGTKLGASGLIQAYKEATRDALGKAGRQEKFLTSLYELKCPVEELGHAFFALKSLEIQVQNVVHADSIKLYFTLRQGIENSVALLLKAKLLRVPVEQAEKIASWGDYELDKIEKQV